MSENRYVLVIIGGHPLPTGAKRTLLHSMQLYIY